MNMMSITIVKSLKEKSVKRFQNKISNIYCHMSSLTMMNKAKNEEV